MDKMSHGASVLFLNGRFESSSFHAEHLIGNEKYKSDPKNKVISTVFDDHISVTEPVEVTGNAFSIFNSQTLRRKVLSETSDGFTAFDKRLSEASDALPAIDEVLSEASDGFTATDNVLSEVSYALPATDRALSEVSDEFTATNRALSETSDGLPATDKWLSEASDGLPAIDKVQSEGSDGLPAIDKVQSEGSDGLPATDKALSEGSDGFTAIESRDNVGFDRLNQRGDAIFSKFARVSRLNILSQKIRSFYERNSIDSAYEHEQRGTLHVRVEHGGASGKGRGSVRKMQGASESLA